MSHLDEPKMQELLAGEAGGREVERVRRHVEECRACARWLEEWRDAYPELDQRYPSLIVEHEAVSATTPDGLVVVPGGPTAPTREPTLELTTLLWIGAVVMAAVVGYAAGVQQAPDRNGRETETAEAVPGYPESAEVAPDSLVDEEPPSPVSTPGSQPPAPPPVDPAALEASPGFQLASRAQVTRHLGGRPRTVSGLSVLRYEIGSPASVAGALPGAGLIRIVYTLPDGRFVFLDQQIIPVDANGFRPIDDPVLETGGRRRTATPTGLGNIAWVDSAGFRLSLTARVPLDSLNRFVNRVR